MRRLQYPLTDGAVGKRAAERAKKVLRAGLVPLVDGRSPVFDAVPDYPKVDLSKLPVFQDLVDTLSSFDAEVEAVRETPGKKAREERTRAAAGLARRHARRSARPPCLRCCAWCATTWTGPTWSPTSTACPTGCGGTRW